MNEPRGPFDLAPDEFRTCTMPSAVPPLAPPVGFRDAVMRRVAERRVGWELLVAALLASQPRVPRASGRRERRGLPPRS